MLPKRADPVTGALIGTIVLVAFLALPVLILAVIVWLAARANRASSSNSNEDADPEFRARFQKLEETILDASTWKLGARTFQQIDHDETNWSSPIRAQ